ncbi:MAG: DsbA family protein [Paludibacteraceae bacterium]|nr:DsbA family protein [Paludibacteraceae bacterium]
MEQNKIIIEFFHDVLCAWCYALSPRVEKLAEKYPDRIEVIHRSFALAPEPDGIARIFGSKEEGKIQILGHWRAANMNDDAHRMNPELMATRTFDYPYSTPGLLACKAAELQGGNEMHHKIFNRIQKAHLTECLNINDFEVLKMCAREVGLDVEQWEKYFHSEKAKQMLDEDSYLAYQYGVNSVPTLIANGKYKLTGAQPYETLEKWNNQIK